MRKDRTRVSWIWKHKWNTMKYRADNCLTVGISFTEVTNVRKNPQISSRNKCNCHEETRKPSNLEYIKFAQLYCTRAPTCCICQKRTQNLEDMKDVLTKILDTLTKPSKRCRICRMCSQHIYCFWKIRGVWLYTCTFWKSKSWHLTRCFRGSVTSCTYHDVDWFWSYERILQLIVTISRLVLSFMGLKIQMYVILHVYVKITSRTVLKGWTACEVS